MIGIIQTNIERVRAFVRSVGTQVRALGREALERVRALFDAVLHFLGI